MEAKENSLTTEVWVAVLRAAKRGLVKMVPILQKQKAHI